MIDADADADPDPDVDAVDAVAGAVDRRAGGSDSGTRPVLEARGLSKAFGGEAAVDDVSLALAPGEFFALLGPSGCGKTTTLRMLAGLESPTAGRVLLDGVDVTDRPANRRDVGLVFQDLVLFPHLTVAENVAYGLVRAGVDRDERDDRVAAMLDLVGLAGFGERDPASLSGGQRQRVALARSLVTEPRVLLLDEPLSSLDRGLREELQAELARIQHEVGTAFLYVTHDQESAMAMADRVAVMDEDRLVETGTPETLYRRPETAFVARFFGDATVVDATVDGDDAVRIAGARVPAARVGDHTTGDRVSVVVRPDDVSLVDPGAAPMSGTVRTVAYRGDHYEHVIDVADGAGLYAHAAAPRSPGATAGVRVERARVVADRSRDDRIEGGA
jgi:spermidine/putrescine transport system ATP-binding protein